MVCTCGQTATISIHAAREGGDSHLLSAGRKSTISIHAAREGGDVKPAALRALLASISIHAAREGGDHAEILLHRSGHNFNPRRP